MTIVDSLSPPPVVSKMSVEQRALYNDLTLLQQSVVLGVLDGLTWKEAFNQCADALLFGDQQAQGFRNVMNSRKVRDFMNSVQDSAELDKRIMTRNEALRVLSRQARSNVTDVIEFKERYVGMGPDGGGPIWSTKFGIRRLADLDDEKLASISEINDSGGEVKVKLHSARQAIETLSRMQGWEAKKEVEATVTVDDETKQLIRENYQKLRQDMINVDDC